MSDEGVSGITASRIQFTDEELTWQDAMKRVAEPLIADGTVEPSYVDAVIATAEKMGPYFDFGRGIAMPHARPDNNVNAVGVSFLRTRTPVLLLDDEKHPIEVFIMLAATDNSSHLTALKQIAGVLTDTNKVAALKTATTPDEVLALMGQDQTLEGLSQ
ncbi:MAG: PTS sugar transporter subunit IIA [Propionibacteriaceae bacterium]